MGQQGSYRNTPPTNGTLHQFLTKAFHNHTRHPIETIIQTSGMDSPGQDHVAGSRRVRIHHEERDVVGRDALKHLHHLERVQDVDEAAAARHHRLELLVALRRVLQLGQPVLQDGVGLLAAPGCQFNSIKKWPENLGS